MDIHLEMVLGPTTFPNSQWDQISTFLCPSACFEHFNAIIENKAIKQIRHDVVKSHNTLKAMKNAALCILMLGPTDQIIQNSKELRCLFHIFQFLIPFYFLSTKRLSTVHNKHKCSTIRLGCSPTSRVTSTSGAFHVTFAAIINIFLQNQSIASV